MLACELIRGAAIFRLALLPLALWVCAGGAGTPLRLAALSLALLLVETEIPLW